MRAALLRRVACSVAPSHAARTRAAAPRPRAAPTLVLPPRAAAARLLAAAAGAGALAALTPLPRRAHTSAMAQGSAAAGGTAAPRFELPPLPFPENALEPHTSARTLSFHHGKHHAAYVANLNKALQSGDAARRYDGLALEELVKAAYKEEKGDGAVFNNAGQVRAAGRSAGMMRARGGAGREGGAADAPRLGTLGRRLGAG